MMMRDARWYAVWLFLGISWLMMGCGSDTAIGIPAKYALTVNSNNPAAGVSIGVSPADVGSVANATTGFVQTYDAGTSVTLTAPTAWGSSPFVSWSGCTTASSTKCTATVNSNMTVIANYSVPPPPTYTLTVNSMNPPSGVAIGVAPVDNNGAANGTTSFTRTYNAATAVTLTAPATSGSDPFVSWSGCTTASSTVCTVAVNSNTTVTANYTVPPPATPTYTLTVNSGGASGVAVGVSPADNNSASNGATSFTRNYNAGTAVQLTAPATSGSATFSSWNGCTTVSTVTCIVALNANTTVSATYVIPTPPTPPPPPPTPPPAPPTPPTPPSNPPTPTYALTVNSGGVNAVAIGVSPADNNSAGNGATSFTRTYNAGTSVTLKAPATSGSAAFSTWSGCTTVSTVSCIVTVNANTMVSAIYVIPTPPTPPAPPPPPPTPPSNPPTPTYVLTVNSTNPSSGVAMNVAPADDNGTSNGTSSLKLTYNEGTSVTLTAPATADGDPLIGWTGCATATTVTCTVTLNANMTVSANYVIPPPTPATYVLTVNSSGVSGVGIDVSPEDNKNTTNGTTDFTLTYNTGTVVTLTAPATSGSDVFTSWTGCATFSTVICTVELKSNTTVVANYAPPSPKTYALTVNSTTPATGVPIGVAPADNNSAANGTTSFTRTYNAGASVTLTAPATSNGNTFTSWSGCTASSSVACTVVVNSNTTVTANYTGPAPVSYELTVDSVSPSSGIAIGVAPADNNNATNGTTSFRRTYNTGTAVTLTAPATSGSYDFVSWSGCSTASGVTCRVTLNSSSTVTATYDEPGALSVSITPNPATVIIGTTQQFTAVVSGTGSNSVTWSLAAPSGSNLSPGTLSSSGLYTTPYPAPATVTITATSTQNTSVSGSVTVSLVAPAAASGPGLTVDAGNQTRSISPYIYGMNAYELDFSAAKAANIPLTRWGGDAASRYNYQLDVTNTAADYYFENRSGNTADGQNAVSGESAFNALVDSNKAIGAATLGTVPVLGWVAKDGTSCSYPTATYPNQYSVDPYEPCGDGELSNQTLITTVLPTDTSVAAGPPWVGGWVSELVNTFGTAANGGVGFYDLDNEPTWWDANHRDVHPLQSTYDEVTNNGIATAEAVKAADPTAEVNGPVVDYWWNYFYSKKDILSGWDSPPCYSPWDNPVDREAHGGIPFIEYYLQQFAAYQAAHNVRLLDYLDLHGYFAAFYPAGSGNSVDLTTAGDTGEQQARVNSTRALWDPTYTDPAYPQPNYSTDSNYTVNCATPLQAPQLIPLMHSWIANSYPGTKTSISEYNWGGQESINGAVAQADVLGIFGSYGLDMATLWGPPNPTTQIPGLMAYEIYRNYDGNDSLFGNQALASVSTNQGNLSVYGALRTADNKITIVVINKTYGDLTSTVSLANLTATAGETAQEFLYSNANLAAIVAESPVPVTPPPSGGTTSTISATFPAQSITLFVLPAN